MAHADHYQMFDFEQALRRVIETNGSDLHLKVPSPPLIRTQGKLEPIPGAEPLSPEATEQTFRAMLSDPDRLDEFEREREVDFSYAVPGVARFRVNAFKQRGSISIVCRAIPFKIKSVEELMLPAVINDIADEERGVILLTGTTGSGKSTTLAAMIDRINTTTAKHIVTIEDPVEFLHKDKMSIINQREVGEDTNSFKRALRRVLRQDPDVILVELGIRRLESEYGVKAVEYPTTRVWSSPRDRARDVNAAFADPEIKAILSSIGGDDQIKILKHLDAQVIAENPKPFFGLSDNTNLCTYLWNLGIVSYYGGTVMTMLGRAGSINPHSAEAFSKALFTHDWYDLRPADSFTDVHKDWADPTHLEHEPEMLPGTGWQWYGTDQVVEGRLWGGCLEIVDFNLRVGTHLPDDAAYDGCVLHLETSEELPTAQYVGEVLMCMGERGLLNVSRPC